MNATIEIDGLRKRFGPVQALDGMTFTVGLGHVTGFVITRTAAAPSPWSGATPVLSR
jgi:ABC-type uncharacterized transport system ATPase subunit